MSLNSDPTTDQHSPSNKGPLQLLSHKVKRVLHKRSKESWTPKDEKAAYSTLLSSRDNSSKSLQGRTKVK